MNIGKLDRRIKLMVPAIQRNVQGEPKKTFGLFKTVFAGYRKVRTSEQFELQHVRAHVDAVFTVRWLAGIDTSWRLEYQQKTYEITGVSEIGRKEGLELMARMVA